MRTWIRRLVVSFVVDDILGAREELATAGVELIGDVVWAAEVFANPALEGFGWFFLRAPDGNVYALQQERAVGGVSESG